MKTKIEIPNGHEIENVDYKTGEVTFKEVLDVTERIKSIDDILATAREKEEFKKFYNSWLSFPGHLCDQYFLELVIEALNEGWVADPNNENQEKFYPTFVNYGIEGFRFSGCHKCTLIIYNDLRLALKSQKLASYIVSVPEFFELYRSVMLKNKK
ncbi:MAG TPA: hypothetical protein VMU29_14955 [Smithella sp.]|nr:hypothetical protein [Smithella sp.]